MYDRITIIILCFLGGNVVKKFIILMFSIISIVTIVGCTSTKENDKKIQEELNFGVVITNLQKNYVENNMGELTGWSEWNFNDFQASEDGKTLVADIDFSSSFRPKGYSKFIFVELVNEALGFGDALKSKMSSTRPIDGMLSDENDKVKVSWSYNTDETLHITYEVK